jgi:hypothetical protein
VPYSPDLGRLLTEGARYRDERAEYVIERHTAGEVHLPTDQVVAIGRFIDASNQRCQPFTWTKDADELIAKIRPSKN